MFYVCSAWQTIGVQAADLPYSEGKAFSGIAAIAGISFAESRGTLTAIDARSGRTVWQKT